MVEAAELNEQVFEMRKRILGEEHPGTLISMNNLALTFAKQGWLSEAAELNEKVLEKRKIVLGEEHGDTLTSMDNLAWTFCEQERWIEAEELSLEVLEKRKRILGEEHRDTLTSMDNLAWTFYDQGRLSEAAELNKNVLEKRKRVLGEEHRDTLTSMDNLAWSFCEQERWVEATELYEQVLEKRKRILGEEHPGTLWSMDNLALTLYEQERWSEAEELYEQVLEKRRRILGEEHPGTLWSMNGLAITVKLQGRIDEAITTMAEVVALRSRVLGTDNLSTKQSAAALVRWRGELKVSERLPPGGMNEDQFEKQASKSTTIEAGPPPRLLPESVKEDLVGERTGESSKSIMVEASPSAVINCDGDSQTGASLTGCAESYANKVLRWFSALSRILDSTSTAVPTSRPRIYKQELLGRYIRHDVLIAFLRKRFQYMDEQDIEVEVFILLLVCLVTSLMKLHCHRKLTLSTGSLPFRNGLLRYEFLFHGGKEVCNGCSQDLPFSLKYCSFRTLPSRAVGGGQGKSASTLSFQTVILVAP